VICKLTQSTPLLEIAICRVRWRASAWWILTIFIEGGSKFLWSMSLLSEDSTNALSALLKANVLMGLSFSRFIFDGML
jgi:hypothetical protein